MRTRIHAWLLSVTAFVALATGAYFYDRHLEYVKVHTIPPGLHAFDVNGPVPACGRWKDSMPKTRDAAAYRLYINARNRWRSKIEWQFTREELHSILGDVQAAASQGDWGARSLLAHYYRHGLGPLESNQVLEADANKLVEILRAAVANGQSWAHYDLGVAYEYGYGGAHQDKTIAWAYYLKAAELGSPDAQMALADAYQKADLKDAATAMIACAFKQEHGGAAYKLGILAELRKQFPSALAYYQAGAKFGSKECAIALMFLFEKKTWDLQDQQDRDTLKALGVVPDPEREIRYEKISDALALNPDLKLTRLDQVVPLPPAELPNWSGVKDAIAPEPEGPPTY